jgi:hypothetical protein
MTSETAHNQAIQLLQNANFDFGWVVADGELVLWEHKEEPPKPLTRPKVNETPVS